VPSWHGLEHRGQDSEAPERPARSIQTFHKSRLRTRDHEISPRVQEHGVASTFSRDSIVSKYT